MEHSRTIAPFMYDNANLFEDILMLWVFGLIGFYRKNEASFKNSIEIPKRLHYSQRFQDLKKEWEAEKKKLKPSLLHALWKAMKTDFWYAATPGIISYSGLVVSSLMIVYIINYINSSSEPVGNIVGYIIAYAFILQGNSLCNNYSFVKLYILVAKIKGLLSQLLFEKTLKTYYGELSQGDQAGKFSSLISSDLEFFEGLSIMSFFLSTPLFLSAAAILLWFNLGISGIIGLTITIFHLPLIVIFGRLSGKYRFASAAIGDSRMKMITNLIEGMRVVKLYGWEHPYLDSLFSKRNQEISQIKKKGLISCISRSINLGSMGLVLFSTFSIYISLGNELNAAIAYSSIAVLMLCTSVINFIGGQGITVMFLMVTSLKRFTQALLLEERPKVDYKTCLHHSIKVKNCSFSWKKKLIVDTEQGLVNENPEYWTLDHINFSSKPGKLIIVIGSVGSGKTALFMGLLKEICMLDGSIARKGKFAFAGEDPWIVSGTIRENILMGLDYDEEWYNKVINSCSLARDLDLFNEYRDQTMIGDRGITLSGGQKARVSLARAVYSNRDIYLLDDPLSAVDPEVCNELFALCIKGILAEKTVILATHQVHFVSQADKILILEDGKQVFFGSYDQLQTSDFVTFLGTIIQAKKKRNHSKTKANEEIPEATKMAIKDIKSILEEERAKGTVPLRTYWNYLMLGYKNWFFFLLMILIQIFAQVSYLSVIFWIGYWSDANNQKDPYYMKGMAVLVVILYIITFLRQYSLQFPLINSSRNLHNSALSGIAFTKSVFFDKNPTGRLINRFAKDVTQMDETLILNLSESIITTALVLGNFIVIIIIAPYVIIVLGALVLYFYFLFRYFARPNKDLKRLELTSKSPILTILNNSIHGLPTIRCLDLQEKFIRDMEEGVKLNLQTYISFQISLRGLQLYLEMGPNLLNVINIIILVLLKSSIQPGLAGLSISLGVTMMGFVGYLFRNLIETDNYMASPQRLFEYQQLEPEGKLIESGDFKIVYGKIEVKGLFMRYRENYDYALKNLSFVVQGGSKTGIVGRTGAGKSSIMQVLFRLVSPEKGSIYIDGQDLMKAGLHEIRKQISAIPQSATLFIASLRDNLDPFHDHSDKEITRVLNKVRLGILLSELPEGLDSQINSKGLSLSAGQKQLVCLARAILRKNKIVMIDEATANVDSETDEFIQLQLNRKFRRSTLLIIAHRLRTVIESDWIIVMDQGCTKEEGSPKNLVKNEDSVFLQMIMHSGPEESQYLLSKIIK